MLKPIGRRLVVEPIKETEKGGLVLPDLGVERPDRGRVVAVDTPRFVKRGDVVYFAKFSGTKLDGDTIIVHEDDVLAVVADQ